MTGWGLAAVLLAMGGICAFVCYWWGRGEGERTAIAERYDLTQEVMRLRQVLMGRAAAEQRALANSRDRVRLSARQIDAWHELTVELDDLADLGDVA
jgi:hypothetical protein